ncbi:MAG: hypothetical protein J6A01_07090 [Proteobacteria bacterium]|nr:hypothetical protein [Pseudomonadota bacterium]
MHSFFKAEWKTILALVVFGGALYGWFYFDAVKKAEKAAAPYEYTCIQAGKALMDYHLGTDLKTLEPQLKDFQSSRDDALHTVRYTRNDGLIALNFRADKLASIEYWPNSDIPMPNCEADIAEFTKTNKPTSESIPANNQNWLIYSGLVAIESVSQKTEDELPSESAEPQTPQKIGWIVMNQ